MTNRFNFAKAIIKVKSNGGEGSFTFLFSLQEVRHFIVETFSGVGDYPYYIKPGTYSLNVAPPAGWTLVSATCLGNSSLTGNNINNIVMSIEKVTECYIVYNKFEVMPPPIPVSETPAYLRIFKFVDDTEKTNKTFYFNIGSNYNIAIPVTFHEKSLLALYGISPLLTLKPGNITILEILPSDEKNIYKTKISCSNAFFKPTVNLGVSVNLVAGKVVECTFTNIATGSIVIKKEAPGASDDKSFIFSIFQGSEEELFQSSVTISKPRLLLGIEPGNYNIYEETDFTPEWKASGASCVTQDGKPTGSNFIDNVQGIEVSYGKVTTCTFKNTLNPK